MFDYTELKRFANLAPIRTTGMWRDANGKRHWYTQGDWAEMVKIQNAKFNMNLCRFCRPSKIAHQNCCCPEKHT